jgi:hypothetical protein
LRKAGESARADRYEQQLLLLQGTLADNPRAVPGS